jgi:calcium-dependent protein kinase
LIHRDIKPENIMFEEDLNKSAIKLIDFGLATGCTPDSPPLTQLLGTPYYIAPEILQKSYGQKADIWSLGVVVYAMLVGRPPINGGSEAEILAKIKLNRVKYRENDISNISAEALDFVQKCLTFNQHKRPPAAEMLQHPWLL